jgi:hypothetical protein
VVVSTHNLVPILRKAAILCVVKKCQSTKNKLFSKVEKDESVTFKAKNQREEKKIVKCVCLDPKSRIEKNPSGGKKDAYVQPNISYNLVINSLDWSGIDKY